MAGARTTISLPAELLAAVDRAVREGKARSRNEFVADALRRELAKQEEAEIDAAFAGMAEDQVYQALSEQLDREFASASWEALQNAEATK
jgi:metal-responsive CopG/Arc/MetJ family transcriptional regulator